MPEIVVRPITTERRLQLTLSVIESVEDALESGVYDYDADDRPIRTPVTGGLTARDLERAAELRDDAEPGILEGIVDAVDEYALTHSAWEVAAVVAGTVVLAIVSGGAGTLVTSATSTAGGSAWASTTAGLLTEGVLGGALTNAYVQGVEIGFGSREEFSIGEVAEAGAEVALLNLGGHVVVKAGAYGTRRLGDLGKSAASRAAEVAQHASDTAAEALSTGARVAKGVVAGARELAEQAASGTTVVAQNAARTAGDALATGARVAREVAQHASDTAADALATGARVAKGAAAGAREAVKPAMRKLSSTPGGFGGNAGQAASDIVKGAVKGAKKALGEVRAEASVQVPEGARAAVAGVAEPPQFLYRAITPEESLAGGVRPMGPDLRPGVLAKGPLEHLHGVKPSEWISFTKDLEYAKARAAQTGGSVLEVDMRFARGEVLDISRGWRGNQPLMDRLRSFGATERQLRSNRLHDFATEKSEVLLKGFVSPEGIFGVQ